MVGTVAVDLRLTPGYIWHPDSCHGRVTSSGGTVEIKQVPGHYYEQSV